MTIYDCVRYQDSVDESEEATITESNHENSREPDQPQHFHAPLPGHSLPLPPGKNVVYWATESDSQEGRQHEDIMLRRVPATVAHRFRGAAGARGFTHAQYLTALVALHEAMRERADTGDGEVAAVLRRLGLATVAI